MTDPNARRYDDNEISHILERASELQEATPEAPSVVGGLTADELEEIAGEVGIERSLVRRAMRELDAPQPHRDAAAIFLGAPTTIRIEQVLPGAVDADGFREMQMDVEGVARHAGRGSLIGDSFRWQSSGQDQIRSMKVQVTSHQGETRILIEEQQHNLAWGVFGGLIGGLGGGLGLGVGLGVGLGALGSALFAVAFPAGVVGGSYLLARGVFTAVSRGRQRALVQLGERLASYPAAEDPDRLGAGEPGPLDEETG